MSGDLTPKEEAQFRMTYLAGITLYTTQRCERVLAEAVMWVRLTGVNVSKESLFAMDAEHFKATLGQLRSALRNEFDLTPEIADRLKKFADHRNRFVHRLFWEPGFDMDEPSCCDVAYSFIHSLFVESEAIASMLSGALFASYKASGKVISPELLALFEHAPNPSVPINDLFPRR